MDQDTLSEGGAPQVGGCCLGGLHWWQSASGDSAVPGAQPLRAHWLPCRPSGEEKERKVLTELAPRHLLAGYGGVRG